MLKYQDDRPFSTGVISCSIRPIHQEYNNRIFIQIEVEGFPVEAALDTGGVYCVLHPVIAEQIQFDPVESMGEHIQKIRGFGIKGNLYRANLEIQASQGSNLLQEVTVFVPNATEEDWDEMPTILGLTGCLEFIRFAIDPIEEQFYFSATNEE